MNNVHWISFHHWQFTEKHLMDDLEIPAPTGAKLWQYGADSPRSEDGFRTGFSTSWGGAAFYETQAEANEAFETADKQFGDLPDSTESWHAVLCPIRFSGVTNWFSLAGAGLQVSKADPGGPIAVLTSAGYESERPEDLPRILDFLDKVEEVRAWYNTLEENVLTGYFQIANPNSDGMTFTIWKNDAAMMTAAYGAGGLHRRYLDQQKSEKLADRTSYLRTRIVRYKGVWNGSDPVSKTTG